MTTKVVASVNADEPERMASRARLSEENLRIHNSTCPKNYTSTPIDLLQEELSWTTEHESYDQMFSSIDDMEDADSDMQDSDIALRRAASLDALKLYTGAFASFETHSYTQMAKNTLDDAEIRFYDLEQLDLGQLASEMVYVQVTLDDTRGSSIGSPSPSSDTLSVSRYREVRNARKDESKNRKRIGVRRRGTLDRTKMPRVAGQTKVR